MKRMLFAEHVPLRDSRKKYLQEWVLSDYACTCQVMETDHRLVRHDMRESMNHGTDHAIAGISAVAIPCFAFSVVSMQRSNGPHGKLKLRNLSKGH